MRRNTPRRRRTNLEALESAAFKAERHANVVKAEENILRATQELAAAKPESETYDKEALKKLGEARAQLEAAVKALQSEDAYTPVGKDLSGFDHRTPPGAGALDRQQTESADGARGDQ